jgi:hypothetical protein
MKKQLLAFVAFGLMAGFASAQSAFEGFYGQVATGFEANTISSGTITSTGNGQSGSGNVNSMSSSNAPLVAGLGYTMMLDKSFSLGLGADYSFLNSNTGAVTTTLTNASGQFGNPITYRTQVSQQVNIYVTPGYSLANDKLVYLKAGYSSENLQAQGQGATSGTSNTTTVGGYILGLGYKQMIADGFYGFAEGNYMSYNKPSWSSAYGVNSPGYTATINSGTPTAYDFLVGLGYKF